MEVNDLIARIETTKQQVEHLKRDSVTKLMGDKARSYVLVPCTLQKCEMQQYVLTLYSSHSLPSLDSSMDLTMDVSGSGPSV